MLQRLQEEGEYVQLHNINPGFTQGVQEFRMSVLGGQKARVWPKPDIIFKQYATP